MIEGEATRFYRHFGYEGREIRGLIPQLPPNADFYVWLEDCIQDLHQRLYERGAPTDYIGLTINSKQFNHGPLWLSFQLIQNFRLEDLWNLLRSAV